MPNVVVPFHQFEIRFIPIINFTLTIKDLVASYIQRTSSFQIEQENTIHQQITLNFDEEGHSIFIWWDRIIFRSVNGIDDLHESNSVVQEPFFSLYEKIKALPSFGRTFSTVFWNMGVKEIEQKDIDKVFSHLNPKYLKHDINEPILPGYNDFAITLDKKVNNDHITISFGPYVGPNDFKVRNVQINEKNISLLEGVKGTFVDYKQINNDSTQADFKGYKSLLRDYKNTIDKL